MAKSIVKKAAPKKAVAKKPALKKASDKNEALGFKYFDKSAGQDNLVPIFERIKKLIQPYAKGSITARESGGAISLVSTMPVEIEGRKKDEVYFAAAMIQKGYVGFYFMPVYMNDDAGNIVAPELMKTLKGKACFYIKKDEDVLYKQIAEALKKGYAAFKSKGWIK